MHPYKQHVRPSGGGLRGPAVEALLAAILRRRFADRSTPIVVAIGGPGGTGKSTFARALARELGEHAAVLRLDDYKAPRATRRQAAIFGAHPEANKMDLIAAHLAALRSGSAIAKPIYDSTVGDARETESFDPVRWLLVDGEVATYPRFREQVDLAVFIDSDWRTQLATRLGRDLHQRNYSPDKAVATFLHSNLREFAEHGAESKNWADIHLFCRHDYRLELESVERELYREVRDLLEPELEQVSWEGLFVDLLTPFDPAGGIDERAFAEHLDWLAGQGVRRVLVGGVAGEFFSLSKDERLETLELALQYFPGLVLFQVGGVALPEAVALARRGEELGADGLVCLPPATFAPPYPDGEKAYVQAVAAVVETPLATQAQPRLATTQPHEERDRQTARTNGANSATTLVFDGRKPSTVRGSATAAASTPETANPGFLSAAANISPAPFVAVESTEPEARMAKMTHTEQEILARSRIGRSAATVFLKQRLVERLTGYPPHVRPPLA